MSRDAKRLWDAVAAMKRRHVRAAWVVGASVTVVVAILAIVTIVEEQGERQHDEVARTPDAAVEVQHSRPAVTTVITPIAIAPASAAPDPSAPLAASTPLKLEIPSVGIDTVLMGLGLLADGTLEVPPDGSNAGWFTGAPTPGEMGPAIIAGHIDWNGPGVFYDLRLVAVGDEIRVTRADGSTAVFGVTEVAQYPKNAFPTAAVYGPVSVAALRVITCGGAWNRATGHYDDNTVVFATLVSST